MTTKQIKVALFEDNTALRQSLSALIKTVPQFELVCASANAINILEDVKECKPDVILMDIKMPGITGIEAVAIVHKNFPGVKVVMQTVFDDDDKVFRSICAGAVGYILKNTPPMQIMDAIHQAYEGGAPMNAGIASKVLHMFRLQAVPVKNEEIMLSDRETEVLTNLSKGMSYKMISEECSISIDTVRFHIKHIYEKLHVHSNTEAISKAFREKLI